MSNVKKIKLILKQIRSEAQEEIKIANKIKDDTYIDIYQFTLDNVYKYENAINQKYGYQLFYLEVIKNLLSEDLMLNSLATKISERLLKAFSEEL